MRNEFVSHFHRNQFIIYVFNIFNKIQCIFELIKSLAYYVFQLYSKNTVIVYYFIFFQKIQLLYANLKGK